MWLLNVKSLKLEEFYGELGGLSEDIPKYAILSHTWGDEEVLFRDMRKDFERARTKKGFQKIVKTCEIARENGLLYVWVDTCCIDKRSSAELSEAINSMYRYYSCSRICLVYLADVSPPGQGVTLIQSFKEIRRSRWFTRGWTLQELLAPAQAIFYASDWSEIGCKQRLWDDQVRVDAFNENLSSAAGIPSAVLTGRMRQEHASIAQKMSWAASRHTKRPEDRAYSLMGIFDVNMAILYGEGLRNAFRRLQLEIMKDSTDRTILAWRTSHLPPPGDKPGSTVLAWSPDLFSQSGNITLSTLHMFSSQWTKGYHMTNPGLAIDVVVYDPANCSSSCKGFSYHQDEVGETVFVSLECSLHSKGIWITVSTVGFMDAPLFLLRRNVNDFRYFDDFTQGNYWRECHFQKVCIGW